MPQPAVSVVMVTHGAWAWTERALAALEEHTAPCYEVIVVDNASPDGTADRLAGDPRVRLVRNARNEGFGPGCNRGAAEAAAPLVCFLNSDALVERGWLEPLVAVVDPGRGVGAAVPCVLELDGHVQCAGALLGRDGSVLEYGNGGAPDDPEVAFPRVVDFGPAACLLADRRAFLDAGGFKDDYAPAYYEDADLCLELAARGLRTVYVPRSRVRHARYGSGDLDGARALSERNRPIFTRRWAGLLAERPATLWPPTSRRVLAARDAPADGRLLFVGAEAVLPGVLARTPWVRVTLVAGDPGWRDRGVEVLDGPVEDVLRARPLHYDAIVAAEGAVPAELARELQPLAALLTPAEFAYDPGALLACAGVA